MYLTVAGGGVPCQCQHPQRGTVMTRGDQRDRDRAKNLKKQQDTNKGTALPEGMTLAQKKAMYTVCAPFLFNRRL